MCKVELTQRYVREALDYNPLTGDLIWRVRPVSHFSSEKIQKLWNGKWAGKPAFTANTHGYRTGRIGGKNYRSHRIIFLWMTGRCPEQVDHEDHVRSNNRWKNLQEATAGSNGKNKSRLNTNTTGFPGVSEIDGVYRASIKHQGAQLHLGRYPTPEEAHQVYRSKAREFGFHPNHMEMAHV